MSEHAVKERNRPSVLIYTDGACSPNPGIGGWAAILISPSHALEKELSGSEAETTNNRMELTAAVEALLALKKPCDVTLTTDSEYVKNAFAEDWISAWQANGWRTKAKKPVANVDLWQRLLESLRIHRVKFAWVRGHAQDKYNNRCDELAVLAREALARKLNKL